jgi:hypothetical protein
MLRVVGRRKWPVSEIFIQQPKAVTRDGKGRIQRQHTPPFMPSSMRQPYHPGGNSLCYMIQTAHLMGCSPIYCLGFTLVNGTGYFFGLENPATGKRSFYNDPARAIDWLKWYESRWPGRARLWPGWTGPVYEVLETADAREIDERCRGKGPVVSVRSGHEPDPQKRHDPQVIGLRSLRQDQPVHADGKQPVRVKVKVQPKGRVIGGRPTRTR